MKLYQVAAIYTPKDKDKEPEVALAVTSLLAKDDAHARLLAARKLSPDWDGRLAEVEVLVRPF